MAAEAVTDVTTGLLDTLPSLTTKLATYVPARSAVKVGLGAVSDDNTAALPVGLAVNVHE